MVKKIIFVGNTLSGDDGIGPRLYYELKDNPRLKGYDCFLLGTLGIDAVTFIEEDDDIIIIDAATKGKTGELIVVKEKDIKKDFSIVSQHDLGIEQAISFIRVQMPNLNELTFILVPVPNIIPFHDKLSEELEINIEKIKRNIISRILELRR
jgi:hydrogenase maturation protease